MRSAPSIEHAADPRQARDARMRLADQHFDPPKTGRTHAQRRPLAVPAAFHHPNIRAIVRLPLRQTKQFAKIEKRQVASAQQQRRLAVDALQRGAWNDQRLGHHGFGQADGLRSGIDQQQRSYRGRKRHVEGESQLPSPGLLLDVDRAAELRVTLNSATSMPTPRPERSDASSLVEKPGVKIRRAIWASGHAGEIRLADGPLRQRLSRNLFDRNAPAVVLDRHDKAGCQPVRHAK